MNISTDTADLLPAPGKSSGGYEWWYFDGLSTDGREGFVIIFYQGNPFSPRYIRDIESNGARPEKYPALSISVYKNFKTVYYSFIEFHEKDFSWDKMNNCLTIGQNSFTTSQKKGQTHTRIQLMQELESGFNIRGTIDIKGDQSGILAMDNNDPGAHSWNLILPRAEFSTDLDLTGKGYDGRLKSKGFAYQDHNTGQEPMKESFRDWYWGRYHFSEATLIYYLMNRGEDSIIRAWLINRENSELLTTFTNAEFSYKQRNIFGLHSARRIRFSDEGYQADIQTEQLADNGPFYQRFIGNAVLKSDSGVYSSMGFSEYIKPGRIYARSFWPLINMRLRYAGERPHWVQKSGRMYPWTW